MDQRPGLDVIDHADQYTPNEILAAAQSAEADGRLDYAVQFYTHLANTVPAAPAGRIAQDALARLQQSQLSHTPPAPAAPAAPGEPAMAPLPPLSQPSRIDDFDPAPVAMADRMAHQSEQARPPAQTLASSADRAPDPYGVTLNAPADPAPAATRRDRQSGAGHVQLPRKRSSFWAGRILAGAVTGIGVFFTIAAMGYLIALLSAFEPANAVATRLRVASAFTLFIWTFTTGLAMILLGQLMSAIFVTAIETRDAARVLRARSHDS